MTQIEEVSDGAEEGDNDAEIDVDADAGGAADVEEVEVEGIDEEADEAGDEKDAVPAKNSVAAGVEDAAGLPRAAAKVEEDGGRWRGDRRAAAEGENPGGGGSDGPHLPRRSWGRPAASAWVLRRRKQGEAAIGGGGGKSEGWRRKKRGVRG